LYFFELERKDRINNGISVPTAIAGGLVSGFVYLISGFSGLPIKLGNYIFCFTLAIFGVLLFCGIYHLMKALFGYEYQYLSRIQDIKGYEQELNTYYTADDANKEFKEFLIKQFIEATDNNTWCNDEKAVQLRKANKLFAYSIIAGTVTILCEVIFRNFT
jgi:hypothetical protein